MKKIAVDIDNTICETTEYFSKLALKFDREILHKNNIINYDRAIPRSDDWTEEETKRFFDEVFFKEQLSIPIKEDASFYIKKLKEKGFEIDFITTRGYNLNYDAEIITKEYFKIHDIVYDKLVTGVLEKYKELDGYDYFIDDFVGQCENAANNTNCKVLMMLERKNKDYNNDKIKKVNNWKEIYEYIISNEKEV